MTDGASESPSATVFASGSDGRIGLYPRTPFSGDSSALKPNRQIQMSPRGYPPGSNTVRKILAPFESLLVSVS